MSVSHSFEVLGSIQPTALSAYACSLGWEKVSPGGRFGSLYSGEGLPEIAIPRIRELADYERVVANLISAFAAASGLSERTVCTNLSNADRDLVRIQIPNRSKDALSAAELPAVFQGIRDLLRAAALSEWSPKPAYRGRMPTKVRELLENVRLDHTERGSFVLVLVTPTIEREQREFWDDIIDAPFTRRATMKLATGLQAASEAATGGLPGTIDDSIRMGLSINLLMALRDIIAPFTELTVELTWAKTLRQPEISSTFGLTNNWIPRLTEAIDKFKLLPPTSMMEIVGKIKSLRWSDEIASGTVSVEAEVEGQPRVVSAILSGSDHDEAISAYRLRSEIVLSGELNRVGTLWELKRARVTTTEMLHD